jgi:hypothetical protein
MSYGKPEAHFSGRGFRMSSCEKRQKELGLETMHHGERKVKESLIAMFKYLKRYCSCVFKHQFLSTKDRT